MQVMRKYVKVLIILLLTLPFSDLKAQEEDHWTIEATDTLLLSTFWKDFKSALNTKNISKLAELVKFPFGCASCDIDRLHPQNKPYIMVTKAHFFRSMYQIFFNEKLIEMVNKYEMPNDVYIFTSYLQEHTNKRLYNFNYLASRAPGRQVWFDIEKIKGKYKIRWVFPLP